MAGITNTDTVTGYTARVINSGAAATLTVNNAADNTYNGKLGDTGGDNFGLTKLGVSSLTLSGTNTYTGATTVTTGTLLVNGTHNGGTTNGYAVGAAGTLGGTGVITTATVTTVAGSKLLPGGTGNASKLEFTLANAASAMNISASSNGTGAYIFDLADPSASDNILLTLGTLSIGAMTNGDFVFHELGGFTTGTYVLFDAPSAITGSVNSASNSIMFSGGRTGTLSLDGMNNNVLLTVIPEPSTALLGAFGALVLLRRRR